MFYYEPGKEMEDLAFEEVKIATGRLVKIEKCNEFNGFYGRINYIPSSILTKKNEGFSLNNSNNDNINKQKSRIDENNLDASVKCKSCYLAGLEGIIELSLQFMPNETMIDEPVTRYYCVCNLSSIDSAKEMQLEKILVKKQESIIIQNFDELYLRFVGYKDYVDTPELVGTLTHDEVNIILDDITINAPNLTSVYNNLGGKVENYEEVF